MALTPASSHGGTGSLPDPFVVTGTDPDTATATINGATAQAAALLQLSTDDDGSNFADVITVTGDAGGPNEQFIFYTDSAGEVKINAASVDALPLDVVAAAAADPASHIAEFQGGYQVVLSISAGGQLRIRPDETHGGDTGLVMDGPHAAPANGSLNPGQCAIWYDQTNGAAKLMVKGKTADGTVVTASVALA